jgi:hypothetical protein
MAKRYQRDNQKPQIEVRTDDTMATRYQRGNQKASIEDAQTIQWPKGTEGIIRSLKSK